MAEQDEFGRHEVLHMAAFLARAVESELCDHAQMQANPEWKALADKAAEALGDLYQRIGAVHLGDNEPAAHGKN